MKNKLYLFIVLLIFLIIGNVFSIGDKSKSNSAEKEPQQIRQHLRGNGLCFTPNKGQITDTDGKPCPDVLYKSSGAGADIYLRKTGISYMYTNMREVIHKVDKQVEDLIKAGAITEAYENQRKDELLQKMKLKIHRVDMDFEGANQNIRTIPENEIEGYNNYYYAHCPNGVLSVKQYNKVTCKNVYNGIDVAYYNSPESFLQHDKLRRRGDKQTGIKYDLIVQPHAEPNQIKLHWKGAESIRIKREGNLVIKTSVNEFTESMPRVYQNINGKIVDVKTKYVLTPISEGEAIINFSFLIYNSSFPLVIDPVTWITYYGGNLLDRGHSVAADNLGNAIFSGSTYSVNFPVSIGAFDTSKNGGAGSYDAFVVKMDPSGSRIFGTYFGGTGSDQGYGIDTDSKNYIYITGLTYSTNMPTQVWGGAFMQPSKSASADAFIVNFSDIGTLQWSTYYGGNNIDEGHDIVIDFNDNILFTGHTSSSDFPVMSAYQPALNISQDAFVAKFNNVGVRQWATFYGGSNTEYSSGITVDPADNIYVCGFTNSVNFPSMLAFQSLSGGGYDAFLFRLNTANGFPIWSTYYGGSGSDYGYAVIADALGNIFLGLRAESASSITTGGAYQTALNGFADGALIKFSNAGARIWGTYVGGNNGEYIDGLAVDINNNIIAAGDTYSPDFPVTNCAYQKIFVGSEDNFIATFNQQGNHLCSTFLGLGVAGGPNNETSEGFGGGCIDVYGGFVYLTGWSDGTYPVTTGAFQTVYMGSNEATFSKLCLYTCGVPNTTADFISPTTNACANTPLNFTLSNTSCDSSNTTYLWSFTGGVPGTSTVKDPGGISWNASGIYNVSVKVMSPCDTITVNKTNYITINTCSCLLTGQFTKGTATCSGCGCKEWIMINATGGTSPYSYTWSDGYDHRYKNQLCPGSYSINIKDKNGCSVNINLTAP